jgi:hypothetical protein
VTVPGRGKRQRVAPLHAFNTAVTFGAAAMLMVALPAQAQQTTGDVEMV